MTPRRALIAAGTSFVLTTLAACHASPAPPADAVHPLALLIRGKEGALFAGSGAWIAPGRVLLSRHHLERAADDTITIDATETRFKVEDPGGPDLGRDYTIISVPATPLTPPTPADLHRPLPRGTIIHISGFRFDSESAAATRFEMEGRVVYAPSDAFPHIGNVTLLDVSPTPAAVPGLSGAPAWTLINGKPIIVGVYSGESTATTNGKTHEVVRIARP
jgi:hypothetical protein